MFKETVGSFFCYWTPDYWLARSSWVTPPTYYSYDIFKTKTMGFWKFDKSKTVLLFLPKKNNGLRAKILLYLDFWLNSQSSSASFMYCKSARYLFSKYRNIRFLTAVFISSDPLPRRKNCSEDQNIRLGNIHFYLLCWHHTLCPSLNSLLT